MALLAFCGHYRTEECFNCTAYGSEPCQRTFRSGADWLCKVKMNGQATNKYVGNK